MHCLHVQLKQMLNCQAYMPTGGGMLRLVLYNSSSHCHGWQWVIIRTVIIYCINTVAMYNHPSHCILYSLTVCLCVLLEQRVLYWLRHVHWGAMAYKCTRLNHKIMTQPIVCKHDSAHITKIALIGLLCQVTCHSVLVSSLELFCHVCHVYWYYTHCKISKLAKQSSSLSFKLC